MSQEELQRVEIIALRRSSKMSQTEAALQLGVTERQVRRLEARVATHGAAGLRSARRGNYAMQAIAACANEWLDGRRSSLSSVEAPVSEPSYPRLRRDVDEP